MDINFEYYKIFYYVAKYHNFTKAAQALNNSQPNITRAMNCLEQQLNTTYLSVLTAVYSLPRKESGFIPCAWCNGAVSGCRRGAGGQLRAFPRKYSNWRQRNCLEYFPA